MTAKRCRPLICRSTGPTRTTTWSWSCGTPRTGVVSPRSNNWWPDAVTANRGSPSRARTSPTSRRGVVRTWCSGTLHYRWRIALPGGRTVSGLHADPGVLEALVSRLRIASDDLEKNATPPPDVEAGVVTGAVNGALALLVDGLGNISTGIASVAEATA